jgi:hypothetical protein
LPVFLNGDFRNLCGKLSREFLGIHILLLSSQMMAANEQLAP